jgi:Spy/CpxP family protein refolding chaperone
MRFARIALPVVVVLLVACTALAAGKKGDKKPATCPAAQQVDEMTKGLTLTGEQKASLADLKKEYGPKLMDAQKKVDCVMTPEQKKAALAAVKEARAAGKKGKEVHDAAAAAANLSDEQKTQMADAKKAAGALKKDLGKKVMSVLTPEQQAQVKKAHKGGKKHDAK